jgi:two-component system response regulator FixJ
MNRSMVYIVDDDPNVLESVQNTVRAAGMEVRAYPSAEDFIQDYCCPDTGCLILDLQMPGMTGMKLIEWLRARQIELPVIVLSGHADIPAVVSSMKLGVAEFLEKPADGQMLVNKVRELLQLEFARCDERTRIQTIRGCFATLTERERELVELLAGGLSSKQIAARLGIALKTVENHRSHLLAKTRAVNVASLVRMKMMAGDQAAFA